MIKLRNLRALALTLIIAFGWGGVAAAQTQTAPDGNYNFTFSDGHGINASGVFGVMNGVIASITGTSTDFNNNASTPITGVLMTGTTYSPNANQPNDNLLFISNPQLSNGGVGFSTGSGNQEINFSSPLNAYVLGSDAGYTQGGSFQATNSVPAPLPGSGWISWMITAVMGAGFGLCHLSKKRRRAAAAVNDFPFGHA